MLERVETEKGMIDIERPVVAKIIKETVLSYKEVVAITNGKGQLSNILNKFAFDKDADFIGIKKDKDGKIDVEIHIIIRFGTRLKDVSQSIIGTIRKNVNRDVNIDLREVVVHIVGIKSKKVTSRNIKIKG